MMLKVGNVVQLASGGPKMTVNSISYNPINVKCIWFAGNDLRDGSFSDDALEVVKPAVTVIPPPVNRMNDDDYILFPNYDDL